MKEPLLRMVGFFADRLSDNQVIAISIIAMLVSLTVKAMI